MTKLFISHSSQDDAFVRELRAGARRPRTGRLDRFARVARRRSALAGDSEGHRGGVGLRGRGQPGCVAVEVGRQGTAPRARRAEAARQGQVPGHPALAEWHQARRAGGVLRRGTDLHPREQRRGRRRGGDECHPRRAAASDSRGCARHAAAEGRAAGGTGPRTHRLEVPRAGRRAPRLGARPARL